MVILLLVFLIFVSTQKRIKDPISKVFIWTFFILWVVQGVLSQFGIYDNYIPKARTIVLVSIHLLFFYMGFNKNSIKLDVNKGNSRNSLVYLREQENRICKNPVFILILLLSFLYVISIFSKYLGAILFAQSISDARADNQLQELYGNAYYYINMLVLVPMATITTFLFAFKTFEKRDWMWLVMGLFLLMYKSLGGGRLGFLNIFIAIVFVGIYLTIQTKKDGSFIKRYSRFLIMGVLAIGLYFLIGLVTAGRKGDVSMSKHAFEENQETTNMHFYNYYVTPLVAFDYSINNNLVEKQGGFHYGALTFNCVEEAFYIVLHKLGFNYNRPIAEYGDLIQENYINLGSMNWNALYTWCNFFYFDLGVFGLILFPFLIGLLVRKIINYFYKKSNVFSASLLVLAYYVITMSMVSFYFSGFSSFFTLILLLFLSNKSEKMISHQNK